MRTWLFGLGTVTGIVYLAAGVLGAWWPGHWDDAPASDQVIWAVLRLIERSPWLGAVLVSVGAVAGALVVFWTIIVLAVAVALVVLSVVYARRASAEPTAADTSS